MENALAAVETTQDVLRVMENLVNVFFTFLLITAVIFIIVAAYNYVAGGSDPETVKKAHRMLAYAVVALAVGLLARSVPFIVRELVEVKAPATTVPTRFQAPYKAPQVIPQDF